MFDERQLATLILLALLTITSALAPPVRAAGRRVIRACTRPSILVAVTLYLIWVALLHALALKLGFWNIRLLGESIFWYGASGLAIFWRIPEAGSKSRIFRLQALSVVKASAFVAFFVNIKPFSLLGELLLQASVGVLTALRLTVGEKEEFAPARRVFDVILTIIAVGVLIHVSHFVINQWQQVDKYQEALKLFMPIWLTLGSLPFLFALAVFAQYEVLTKSWRTRPKRLRPGRRARLGVILALRGRPRDIHDFSNAAYHSDSTTTLREGITAVRTFKNRRAERAAAEQTRTERPARYADVDGTDEKGRRRDQREFKESKDALLRLSFDQMGWYDNLGGRYRPDLLDFPGSPKRIARYGLPEDHGIVMKVRNDGRAWYAYRRTVSGWVLGIGSQDNPRKQWFYEGPEPPSSFPARGNGWGDRPYSHMPNWG